MLPELFLLNLILEVKKDILIPKLVELNSVYENYVRFKTDTPALDEIQFVYLLVFANKQFLHFLIY